MRFFFSSRRRHTRSVSAFLLNRSSDLRISGMALLILALLRSEERFSGMALLILALLRSEERRVGKEGRSWRRRSQREAKRDHLIFVLSELIQVPSVTRDEGGLGVWWYA